MITNYNEIPFNIITITLDFEPALINSIKNNFNNIRIVDCLFHYSQALRCKLCSLHLFKSIYKDAANTILQKMIIITWKYSNNINCINESFKYLLSLYKDNNELKEIISDFFNYYNSQCNKKYLDNTILNYKYISKLQRANSYI